MRRSILSSKLLTHSISGSVINYFNLGTGLMMVLPNGWQPYVNFRAMVGNEQFNNYAGTFGLRIEL